MTMKFSTLLGRFWLTLVHARTVVILPIKSDSDKDKIKRIEEPPY